MGLLKIISSLFHGTEKSSELFEAEIPVAQENTSHDLMAGHVEDKMAYADSSSIAPDERPFYQPDGECKIVCVKGLYKSTSVLAY